MKTFLFSHFSFLKRSALLLGSLFLGQVLSAQTSSTLEPPAPHDSAYYARMQWFDNAKLGVSMLSMEFRRVGRSLIIMCLTTSIWRNQRALLRAITILPNGQT